MPFILDFYNTTNMFLTFLGAGILALSIISDFEKSAGVFSEENSGCIVVEITNLKNDNGQVGILLFEQEAGFPNEQEKAFRAAICPINEKKVVYRFSDIPYGRYAITIMHDENSNGRLDLNFLGIPREGYGFSNDAKGFMGPPSFEAAALLLDRSELMVSIKMNY